MKNIRIFTTLIVATLIGTRTFILFTTYYPEELQKFRINLLLGSRPGLVASFFTTLNVSPSMPRLLGGTHPSRSAFPWVISLQYKSDDGWVHNCGGAIMDPFHIVSAGHCVWDRNASDIVAVAGVYNIKMKESSQQRRELKKIFLHPNYTSGDGPGPYDIAVIRVKKPFILNKYVKTIELAACNEVPEVGEECVYAGWGNMFPVSSVYYRGSDVLVTEETTIISIEECKEIYSMFRKALATAVCSQSGVLHGTCQGDSGGPLTCFRDKSQKQTPYLAGAVSFGFPVCNDGHHPDVYTSIGNPLVCNFFHEYESLALQNRVIWVRPSE